MDIFNLIVNIFAISLPFSIFEIIIEKDKGWGAGLPKDTWYGKHIGEKSAFFQLLADTFGVPYFFGYGILAYFIIVPLILVLEYFFLTSNILFLLATLVGVLFIEDFLWFVLNPHFDSLNQLLKGPNGTIWWHTKWSKVTSSYYLPTSYVKGSVALLILITLSYLI